VRALLERTADPAQRLYNRGWRGVTTMPGATVGDVASVGTAVAAVPLALMGAPEAAAALAGGTAVQGLAEAAGASTNTARILGAVAEPIVGIATGGVGVRSLERKGAAIAREGDALRATPSVVKGVPQTPPKAALGGELQVAARSEIARQRRMIGGDIGRLEAQITRSGSAAAKLTHPPA
jgi:hypothetical protein